MLEFQYPDMLLGMLILPPVAVVFLFLTQAHGWAWKIYSILLPLLAAALVLMAASGPSVHIVASAQRIIVALDDSPAAVAAPWHQPLWLQEFLKAHISPDVHITLVTFARHPHVIGASLLPNQLPTQGIPQTASSHAAASTKRLLEFAGVTPCWIFTTGLLHWKLPPHTLSPAAPIAETIIPPVQTDVGITHLQRVYRQWMVAGHHPRSATAPPPQLQMTVRATGPATAMLLERSVARVLVQTRLHFLHSGEKMILLPPLARRVITAHQTITVALNNDDLWPGDNKASIRIPLPNVSQVLIVTNHPESQNDKVPGWNAKCMSPAEFSDSLQRLENFQALVLDNIAIRDLPRRAEKAISAYVRNIGGGLLITGVQNAFGPGGYGLPRDASGAPSWLEELSPLSCLPPHPKPQHIIFLMDVSGSLGNPTASGVTRFTLAARAACTAVQWLKPRDQITVLLFSGSTRKLIDGEAQSVRPLLPDLLAKITPNGPTRPNSALPALRCILTKKALLIVVTDGRIPHLNVSAWKRLLIRFHVRFAVIAPGRSSRATRQLVAQTGAMQFPMRHFRQWGHFLRAAVIRQVEGKPASRSIPWQCPTLHLRGRTNLWDRVYRKPATTLLARSGQHPLAALWRRGLGKVAAVCFADHSMAASALRSSLLNLIKAPAGNHTFYVSAKRRNGHWRILVRATHHGQFLNQRHIGLTALEQHGDILTIPLPQIAPGEYRATLPESIHAFSATVWQIIGHGSQKHDQIIGHIAPPLLPNRYFPATGEIQRCPWPGAKNFPANSPAGGRWKPGSTTTFNLADALWALAALAALSAIMLSRIGY